MNMKKIALLSTFLVIVMVVVNRGTAQSCSSNFKQIIINCLLPSESEDNFTCGGFQGQTSSIADLIASNVLLPSALALTTPQKIIIFGRLRIDQDYTFAEGSKLIFARDNTTSFGLNISPLIDDGKSIKFIGTEIFSTDQDCNNLRYIISSIQNCSVYFEGSTV